MRNLFLLLGVLVATSASFAQTAPPQIIINQDGEVHPWNHLNVNNGPETFQFAIVTDRTGGLRRGIFPDAVKKLNLLQPEFVMSVGDLISGYTEDTAVIAAEWKEFNGFIGNLQMPFFYVPGNHDYINPVMAAEWKKRYGKDYYHFVYKDVLFLCLNSEEKMRGAGKGFIDEPQLAYIKKALAENPHVKWTLLFLHQPLWDQEDSGKWPEVEKLLEGRKHTVYAGHRHRYVKYERNNSRYFILATTGGGSNLRGPRFGEFDHVVWITMTDDGPIMANLLLNGIWDENVNTEGMHLFTEGILTKHPLQMEAMLVEGNTFSEGKINLRISNDSDVPMKAEVSVSSNEILWAATDGYSKTLEPNTVEIVSIPLKTSGATGINTLSPVKVNATMTYHSDKYPELVLNQTHSLKPEKWFTAVQQKKKIEVDGNLKEWDKLENTVGESAIVMADPFSHQGTADCAFDFGVRYDDKFVYAAIKVTDDQLEETTGRGMTNQEGFAFFLDARPMKESAGIVSGEIFQDYLLIAVPQPQKQNPSIYLKDRLPGGIVVATQAVSGGYTAEVAIPVSYLNELQGGSWKHFRLNVVASDSDREGKHQASLFWQPDWRGKEPLLGAGMFRKQ
ncbi:MAG: metallophosphoesterase [Bacteroidia bacterium]|nr:metallophosphoesterase [Bacteroidia bacterium]